MTGIDPATVNSVLKLKWDRGDARHARAALTDSQALLDANWAKSHDVAVGETVKFTTPAGKTADLRDRGHVQEPGRA